MCLCVFVCVCVFVPSANSVCVFVHMDDGMSAARAFGAVRRGERGLRGCKGREGASRRGEFGSGAVPRSL